MNITNQIIQLEQIIKQQEDHLKNLNELLFNLKLNQISEIKDSDIYTYFKNCDSNCDSKIKTIKHIRQLTNISLREALALFDKAINKYNLIS